MLRGNSRHQQSSSAACGEKRGGREGRGGSAPPGTIIRRRGTLKYPGVPQRQEVTGYAPEICATTATLFARVPKNARTRRFPSPLPSLSLCFASSLLLLHFSSFFPLPPSLPLSPRLSVRSPADGGLLRFFR